MKKEIRQATPLSQELEDVIFNMRDEALGFLAEKNYAESESKIKEVWSLIPEPKFNTSCSDMVLDALIEILTVVGKHEESKAILADWITDLETSGYKIIEPTPYILSGANCLYRDDIDGAKEQFYKAVKHGATKRDFSDQPALYFDIAKKKIVDHAEIRALFLETVATRPLPGDALNELTEEITQQIEELSERGNEHFDKENYRRAVEIWKEAQSLIPHPQNSYAESQWLETSIGDAYFLLGEHAEAFEHFNNAKSNVMVNAYENPFIVLRLGQTALENNQIDEAKEFLLRAYMFEGKSIFENDDEKYFAFLSQNVNLK